MPAYNNRHGQSTPTPRTLDFDSIPVELKNLNRWVNWRIFQKDGKPTKVPINPKTGEAASCSDPNTWGTYGQAVKRFKKGGVNGIGFQLGAGNVGIDLDKCRNAESGVIDSWALEILRKLNSYSEVSPSGEGVHTIAWGTLPPKGRRRGAIELYSDGRFFTVTGDHLDGTPQTIKERSRALKTLHRQVFGKPSAKEKSGAQRGSCAHPESDAELIERAHRAANGAKFDQLWSGNWTGYDSQSEADLALCVILAFWTGRDTVRIDALFRRSGLFRNKWDERHGADGRTYGQITIDKAIAQAPRVRRSSGKCKEVSQGAEEVGACLPAILVNDRQLREVTEDALKALVTANNPPALFVRSGHLVRIRSDETGVPAIEVVTQDQLRARLTEISNSVRSSKNGLRDCFPPVPLIENILALGAWPFPPLRNLTEVPVLRPDGTVLHVPGYDSATQLAYLPAPGLKLPKIPSVPTGSDIASALDLIEEMIGDFPFVGKPDKANLLATALTPVLRPAISGPTPLALIDAPQAGTGKGLLAEAITLVGTGRATGMMAAPRDEDEWRKHLTAVLASGASVVMIDNIEHRLESAPLAVALTARVWEGRILGLSKTVTVPVRVTWIASGNNVRLGGDIPRRCYRIRLDAKMSRPWERTEFKHSDLLAWVSEQRGELLCALLTLCAAWYAAHKPHAEVPAIGSFEEWACTVGGVLHYAGITGFLVNLEEMYESSDESTPQWEAFLQALATAFGQDCFTAKQLTERIAGGDRALAETVPDELADAVEKPGSFQKRLGHAFSKRVATRYGDRGIHLERAGEKRRATKWKVSFG
jgi:hypothetical protein